jgi:hypothetical protein
MDEELSRNSMKLYALNTKQVGCGSLRSLNLLIFINCHEFLRLPIFSGGVGGCVEGVEGIM